MRILQLTFLFIGTVFYTQAQITQDWALTNGTTANDAIDFPTSSASDNAGNTYISGWSTYNEGNAGQYLFLKKISSSGQLDWEKAFDVAQSFNSNSYSRIAIDNQQNIIIAAPDQYYNGLFVSKVSPTGTILWSDTLNPGSLYRVAKVLTDNNNNIYIGGSNGDFVLIKYNQDGVLQYNLSIEGGLSAEDLLVSMSLENNNQIILSGNRGDINTSNAAIVFKYDANGTQLWNTAIQSTNITQIELKDHVVVNDEIFVCGYFYSASTDYRGYITKLNNSGVQGTVSIDPQVSTAYYRLAATGNDLVVVSGDAQIFGSNSLKLKRFNALFAEAWSQSVPSGGFCYQLLTHQNSNIFLFCEHGLSSNIKNTIHKFNDNGDLLWSVEKDSSTYLAAGNFISISSSNSVRLTAPYEHSNNVPYNDYLDAFVFDLNTTTGSLNWTYQYDGTTFSEDRTTLLTKDSQGNIYTAGTFSAAYNNTALGIAKYSNTGNLLWLQKLDISAGSNKDDAPLSIVCDAQDNLILAGYSTNTNRDFLLMKFNPAGTVLWQKVFDGTGNNNDQFSSVITDASSNIYAAGLSVRNFGGTNNFYVHQVYKYDPNGTEVWENWDYSNTTGAQQLILSPSQQMLYVGCEYYGSTTNPSDIGVFKLRADNGSYLHWISYSGTSTNSNDRLKGIAIDSLERIYLNGNVNNAGLKSAVIKYDSTLTEIWDNVYTLNGIGNQFMQDRNQDVLVTLSTMTADSIGLLKYSKNGSLIWSKKLIDNLNNLNNIQIKQLNDSLYVVACIQNNTGSISQNKIFVLDTTGTTLFTYTTSNTESYILRDIEVQNNALYVCGFYSENVNHFSFHENYFIGKYLINTGSVQNLPPTITSVQDTLACTTDGPLQISFMVGDENLPQLSITAVSSNPSVLPNSALSITGFGASGLLTITLSGSTPGQTTITINVQDASGLSASSSFDVQVDLCTGLKQVNANTLAIFPNPASQSLFVQTNEIVPHQLMLIYTMAGQLVKEIQLTSLLHTMDIGELTPGTYRAIIVNADNKTVNQKTIQIIR